MEKIRTTVKSIGILIIIYSVTIFFLGLLGFIIKKSLFSFITGGLGGLIFFFSGIQIMSFHIWGMHVSLILLLTLEIVYFIRVIETITPLAPGMMLFLNTVPLLIIIFKLRKINTKNPKGQIHEQS